MMERSTEAEEEKRREVKEETSPERENSRETREGRKRPVSMGFASPWSSPGISPRVSTADHLICCKQMSKNQQSKICVLPHSCLNSQRWMAPGQGGQHALVGPPGVAPLTGTVGHLSFLNRFCLCFPVTRGFSHYSTGSPLLCTPREPGQGSLAHIGIQSLLRPKVYQKSPWSLPDSRPIPTRQWLSLATSECCPTILGAGKESRWGWGMSQCPHTSRHIRSSLTHIPTGLPHQSSPRKAEENTLPQHLFSQTLAR